MGRQRYTSKQIIAKLRKDEVALLHGMTVGQSCQQYGTAEQTYYRRSKQQSKKYCRI